eukprot:TRINITY_DN357_c0_g2_i1.p1 TRINITY_DN357_c0_g2~~TRINITY_DN357_c0_g2_i1.p1  ORF type:complete len:1117 (-),score=249.82 TRINITY_DN357_c0_g2_i1:1192-4497(-)
MKTQEADGAADLLALETAIVIPINSGDPGEELAIDVLPEDSNDLIEIFKTENSDLALWLRFAVEYYKRDRTEEFEKILRAAASPEVDVMYPKATSQRIAILNALAAYATDLAAKTKDVKARNAYFDEATIFYNRADKIDVKEQITWVGKGLLLLRKNDLDRALNHFSTALDADPNSIPARLGSACVAYNREKYDDALRLYRECLQRYPGISATVRLGIGLCLFQLKRYPEAQAAFNRVLELDPSNVDAMIGSALLTLTTGDSESAIPEAMKLFKQAYDLDKSRSMVLNHLANHFFFRKEYQKVHTLASNAYHNTEVPKIKAESCYYMAKTFHAQRDYPNAFQHYFQACRLNSEFPLAQFGLGQMYLQKKSYDSAMSAFEKVIAAHPDHYETLRILGTLYAHADGSKHGQALATLKRAVELVPTDAESWAELGALTQASDPTYSLKAYENAVKFKQRAGERVSVQLWNNVGVLRQALGQYDESLEAYNKSLELLGGAEPISKANLTVMYNIARLHETTGRSDEAVARYRAILAAHPTYVDCNIRLGCIFRDAGRRQEAEDQFKEVLTHVPDSADAWSFLGNLALAKEEWGAAQNKFDRILKDGKHQSDAYAQLQLGNIAYNMIKPDMAADKLEASLKRAHDHYRRVLQRDPSNVYAANGIAIVMAERGDLARSKDTFLQVREASDIPDAMVNLAHLYLRLGQCVNAIKMYENVSRKCPNDLEVMGYLARAHFEHGNSLECVNCMKRISELAPNHKGHRFNFALAKQLRARELLTGQKRKAADATAAIDELSEARLVFEELAQAGAGDGMHPARAKTHAEMCADFLDKAKITLAHAQQRDNEAEQKLREQMDSMNALKRQKAEKDEQEQLAKARADEEVARLAEEFAERARQKNEEWVSTRSAPKQSKTASSRRKRQASDDDVARAATPPLDTDDNDEGESWKRARDAKNAVLKNIHERKLAQEEEAKSRRSKRKPAAAAAADAEEETRPAEASSDGEQAPASTTTPAKSKKRRVDDDDEETTTADAPAAAAADDDDTMETDDGIPGPSKTELRSKITELLNAVDLNTVTERMIRQQLTEHFGVNLDARRPFIKGVIESVLPE